MANLNMLRRAGRIVREIDNLLGYLQDKDRHNVTQARSILFNILIKNGYCLTEEYRVMKIESYVKKYHAFNPAYKKKLDADLRKTLPVKPNVGFSKYWRTMR